MIDIDYFKKYNDFYGHQAGDDCLIEVSDLMSSVFRRAGDIVARYGGEEFIIAMANSTIDESRKAIKQFQKDLAKKEIKHETSMVSDNVTISAGLVNLVPTHDDTIRSFIQKADNALYTAKASGRNQLNVYEDNDG